MCFTHHVSQYTVFFAYNIGSILMCNVITIVQLVLISASLLF